MFIKIDSSDSGIDSDLAHASESQVKIYISLNIIKS